MRVHTVSCYCGRSVENCDTVCTMALAMLTPALRCASLQAAKAVAADKAKWLTERAEGIAADCRAGSQSSLWDLVRQCGGRRQKSAVSTRAVLRDAAGKVATNQHEAAGLSQARFAEEFAGACR